MRIKQPRDRPLDVRIKELTELLDEMSIVMEPLTPARRVTHLLSSLPEKYDGLVSAMEGEDAPKWAVAVERLRHHETKLKIRAAEHAAVQEEEALAARFGNRKQSGRPPYGWGSRDIRCFGCGKLGHIRRYCQEHEEERPQEERKKRAFCANDGTREDTLLMVSHALTTIQGNDKSVWIVDSGATSHMCNDPSMFSEVHTLEGARDVTLGDGRTLEASGRGIVRLTMDLATGRSVCASSSMIVSLKEN